MKKLFIIITFICIFTIFNIESMSDYSFLKNDNSYNIYSVYVNNVNTKNIYDYFKNMNVVRIYPKINPIYKNMMGDIYYGLISDNLSKEIDLFSKNYLSLIKKNSYLDYSYLYVNGIIIDRIDIYISGSDLYDFLNLNDDLIVCVK